LRKFSLHPELEDQEKLELEELGICGLILGDLYLEALSKSLMRDEGDRPSKIEMAFIIIDNKETMLKVMDIIANIPKKIRASVSLDVRNIGPSDFMEMIRKDFVRMMNKSHIKIDFDKIPGLSDLELKSLKKIFYEYQQAKSHPKNKADTIERKMSARRIYPLTEEVFVFSESEGCGRFSLEDEGEWEESEEGYEEEISETSGGMGYLLDDDFEDIDEDI